MAGWVLIHWPPLVKMNIEQHVAFTAGLIGKGIQASLTTAIHMAEGRAQGLQYQYELFDLDQVQSGADQLSAVMADMGQHHFGVLNMVHPFKHQVVGLFDDLSQETRALGAANTIVLRDGRRSGHNTDRWYFAESFCRRLPGANVTSIVQLGAGGAGAATAYAILRAGAAMLTIFDPDEGQAGNLVDTMRRHFDQADIRVGTDLAGSMATATGLVCATLTAMPLPVELLDPSLWVAESVYFPLETELVLESHRRGCKGYEWRRNGHLSGSEPPSSSPDLNPVRTAC